MKPIRLSTFHKVAILVFAAIVLVSASMFRPLPSDQEMIDFFYQHRSDFEYVVQEFRQFSPKQHKYGGISKWDDGEAVKNAKQRAAIQDVATGHHMWVPDPYNRSQIEMVRNKVMISGEGWYGLHPYVSLIISPIGSKFTFRSLLVGEYYKAYYHIPQPIRIREGLLIPPEGGAGRELISKSTDISPWIGKQGRCYVRAVTDHWYLAVCKSYVHSLL